MSLKLFDDFEPSVVQSSLKVLKVQQLIVDYVHISPEKASSKILKLILSESCSPLDFSYCLYCISRYKTRLVPRFIKITKIILDSLKNHEKKYLRKEIKRELLERYFFPLPFRSTPFIYIYLALQEGIFSEKIIFEKLEYNFKMHHFFLYFNLLYFAWFAPLIKKNDPDLYLSVISNDVVEYKQQQSVDIDICEFFDNITEYEANDWELQKFLCKNGYYPNSIEEIIAHDDIIAFCNAIKNPNISYETKIHSSVFNHAHILSHNNNLIELAAFYGSEKIFRFLFNFIDDISVLNSNSKPSVDYFSIFSDNHNIIKICNDANLDFSLAGPYCAACFYSNELLKYFIEAKNFQVHTPHPRYGTVLFQCISSNNLETLFYLIQKCNSFEKSDYIESLQSALPFNRYHTTKFIINCHKIIDEHDFNSFFRRYYHRLLFSDYNIFKIIKQIVPNIINNETITYDIYKISDKNVAKSLLLHWKEMHRAQVKNDFFPIFFRCLKNSVEITILLFELFRDDIQMYHCTIMYFAALFNNEFFYYLLKDKSICSNRENMAYSLLGAIISQNDKTISKIVQQVKPELSDLFLHPNNMLPILMRMDLNFPFEQIIRYFNCKKKDLEAIKLQFQNEIPNHLIRQFLQKIEETLVDQEKRNHPTSDGQYRNI